MNNMASIAGALEKLGFDAALHTALHTYSSLQLPKFTISYKATRERDIIKCSLFFQRKDNSYACLYYDAILRKEIVVPNMIVDGIEVNELDTAMHAIDWNKIFTESQDIASITSDLQKLASSKEGREYAEQLKVKYWCDTPLENCMNVFFLKQKFEISQRFYFLNDGNGISIDEAYRFLNNKWMERQLKKKPVVLPVESKPVIKKKRSKPLKSNRREHE